MSLTMQQDENRCLIRLDGYITLASAEELKTLLLRWLSSGNALELDLAHTESLDVTAMQLLWAAGRESLRTGTALVANISDAVRMAMKDAGFDRIPGLSVED